MLYPERPIENHLKELHVHTDLTVWCNALLTPLFGEEVEFELGLSGVLMPSLHLTVYLREHLP